MTDEQPAAGGERAVRREPATAERRHDVLDVVRAIAAGTVLLTHMGNPLPEGTWEHAVIDAYHTALRWTLWSNGGLHGAVIVFIVLSGFCIHMTVAKRGASSFDLRRYAIRRAVRIYPVLLAAMALGIASECATNPTTAPQVATNAVQNLTLVSGVLPLEAPLGNHILLTVIVECLLYAVYPLGLAVLKRASWGTVFAATSLVYVANVGVMRLAHPDLVWAQRNLWALLLYWWFGAWAAELAFSERPSRVREWLTWRRWLVAAAAYLVVSKVGNVVLHVSGFHLIASAALALVTAAFLTLALREPFVPAQPTGAWKLLSRVGDRSYSLYVVHWPVLTVLLGLGLGASVLGYLGVLAAVVLACLVMYECVESPSHELALSWGSR